MGPLVFLRKIYLVTYVVLFTIFSLVRVYWHHFTSRGESARRNAAATTKAWGSGLMRVLGVEILLQGEPISKTPTLFVGNHMSYLDIPVFYALRNATFVAKKEVARWPVFGPAAASVGTVFVDRDSLKSRSATSEAMRHVLLERKLSVVIFPEGTSSLDGKTWRHGALKMAEGADLWVQPFAIYYDPPREAAYIDEDSFMPHLWKWVGTTKVRAVIHFFSPRKIQDAASETEEIQSQVQSKWQDLARTF